MNGLVLSLFPGIGMLDRAFELEGFCVVRGPDALWGGDVRRFHPPRDRFDGIIGGPPCQKFSTAGEIVGTSKLDLIGEFVRVVDAARPSWVVMENVTRAMKHPAIPKAWCVTKLRDWDCGGATSRTRAIWTWPFLLMTPPRAAGDPSHSVMASTHKRGRTGNPYLADKGFLAGDLPIAEYARLQGADEIGAALVDANSSRAFAVQMLGNGVPLPMGRAIARMVRNAVELRSEAAE